MIALVAAATVCAGFVSPVCAGFVSPVCAGFVSPVCAGFVSPAGAAPPRQVRITATGACPSADAVAAELQTLFPALAVSAANDRAAADDAVLTEEPAGLWVTLGGARRHFQDPSGRCADRARFAAVFLAVALYPPELGDPPPVTPVVPGPPLSPPPPPSPVVVEVGPLLLTAPGSDQSTAPVAIGAGLRLLAGKRHWGRARLQLTLGAGIMASTLHHATADAEALWIPVDAGARLLFGGPRLEGGAELSAEVAPVHLGGQNVVGEAGWRVQVGARLSLIARLWLTDRLGLTLSAYGHEWPTKVRLDVGGAGTVGHTPSLWVGGKIALTIKLR